ncbi:MAG: bifunctional 3,4-dihydroxy-2-butanone-4-phosphate synthase/GTP cyclohydrolase II [Gammaproteobacteria bacterium]|nr:bifunctional 3,4-dihydroxy-2-butanone-4-phosphate synthase/GTP cyclohydrolase II [Gammaproteobacteria bacterium]
MSRKPDLQDVAALDSDPLGVFNTTEELIEEIHQGRMVVLMDDEDRENEGDLVMAASCVRAEDINFMARYGRGLICLTLTRERCEQLRLPLMVSDTNALQTTNFTVSIEAATGVSTGISAADRATTVLAAVKRDARPSDLTQPGHIFPLMAQPGGVLTRAGHTEAGSDLARLAGFEAAAVIVEILSDDGSMARRPELMRFARQHGLKIGTIADLIRYRMRNEKTIELVSESRLPTEYGDFLFRAYHDRAGGEVHFALVRGEVHGDEPMLVRVHMEDRLYDTLRASVHDTTWSLDAAMRRIAAEPSGGVLVLVRGGEDARTLTRRLQEQHPHEHGAESSRSVNTSTELRGYGIGAQILADLGVHHMRVLGSPRKLLGLSGFGLEIVEYVAPGA